jgi:uncharacterized membrane protein YidH (DUF202 family)
VRTALSFIAFGFVVARFSLFSREVTVVVPALKAGGSVSIDLGIAMVLVGIAVAVYGAKRYVEQHRALRDDAVVALSERGTAVITIVLIALGAIVAFDLLALR